MARKIGSRYVALSVLGRGSCGTVWRGEGPEGPVAIKLLREDLASDQVLVARFVQERTALTSLDHPNVVGVHDLVVDGSDLALVMDLVEGTDLRTRLERDKVLTPHLAVSVCADVAAALAVAHAEGVIHRDVKPENVLLDTSGGGVRARLTDFGIARLVDAPRRTRATRIIGTPDYLAPEIIEGLQPKAAVDVYALATVLYELLTGWTPFGGGHPGAVLRRHVTEPVPGIPGLPGELASILASCLSKAPAARLTAREAAERLREALPVVEGMPPFDVPAPEPAPERKETPVPRRAGVVHLVASPELDGTRDTHTNLVRPPLDGGPPGGRTAGAARPPYARRRAVALLVALLLVGAGAAGAWWWAGRDDSPRPPADGAGPAAGERPAAPGAGAAATGRPVPVWNRWAALPVAPIVVEGGPAAAQAPGDRPYVLVRDTAGQPWFTSREGGRWADWDRLPAFRAGEDLAVAAPAPGRLEVFAVSAGDRLLHRVTYTDGRWGAWTRLDARTRVTGAPAVAASGDRVDIVVRTGDALAAGTATNGAFGGFSTVPSAGRLEEAPALAASAPGVLDAFVVRAGDHALLRVAYDQGTWREPERIGVSAAGRPAAAWGEATGLVVVVRDREGRLVTAVPGEAGWRTGLSAGQVAEGPALTAAEGAPQVWTRTTAGRIQTGAAG